MPVTATVNIRGRNALAACGKAETPPGAGHTRRFQKQPGKDDASSRRGVCVGVREPGMKREQRHLDGEPQEEPEEQRRRKRGRYVGSDKVPEQQSYTRFACRAGCKSLLRRADQKAFGNG